MKDGFRYHRILRSPIRQEDNASDITHINLHGRETRGCEVFSAKRGLSWFLTFQATYRAHAPICTEPQGNSRNCSPFSNSEYSRVNFLSSLEARKIEQKFLIFFYFSLAQVKKYTQCQTKL